MQYMGGKFRVRKQIVEYLNMQREFERPYLEPFVGAGWILAEMEGQRYASDVCQDLILLYEALQGDWNPPTTLTEAEYKSLQRADPSALRAFAGFGCSFSGKWFGGYARNKRGDDFCANARNSLLKIKPKLDGVTFSHKNYWDWRPYGMLIYCDPPYSGTTGYGYAKQKFDWDMFWACMRNWSKTNVVVISEWEAPIDFKCVLEINSKTEMRDKVGVRADRIERLFRLESR